MSSSSVDDPVVGILFFGLCLLLGIASRHLLQGTKVPYTVALLVIGVALGCLEYGTSHRLGKIGDGIRLWAKINPDLLLAVFLPALLFESSFSMEAHQIKRCMVQMFLLAGPGVLISTFILGAALKLAFPYDWSWKISMLLGGLLSATDPVAVVALLKDLGARKKLSTIIEGESLMNDGMAMVVYQLFYQMVLGRSFSVGASIKYLIQASVGAVGIGVAFGIASIFWLGFLFSDTVIEITLTLSVSYIAYFTAQDGADVSGILTVMTLGMFYSLVARTAFKGDGQQSLHHFWEMVAYIANTLIFILSGVIIAEGVLNSKNFFKNHETLWGYLILLYVIVQLSRVIVVGLLYPCLRHFGYGLDWKEATILAWSGLRGPVALSLALSVKRTSDSSPFLSQDTGTLFIFFTGWIVFLTLVVNGSTAQFLLSLLRMDTLSEDNLSETKRRIFDYIRYEMMNKALDAFGDLGDDEELGTSDWPTVKRYIACLDNLDGEQVQPHTVPGNKNKLDTMNVKDIRIRLLIGVQAAYWGMVEEGRVSQTTANILLQSVDEAMDSVSYEALCDWNGLKVHVHFPRYYRLLQLKICPQKLLTFFTVERLELGCYICAAFLRAHRIARRQLRDFLGDTENASLVMNESEEEGKEAKKFLENVRVIFPQVLRILKTRQMTHSVLKQLGDYIQNIEKVGLSEEKEMIHLHDAVQSDLKRHFRNPPLVKMPKTSDLLRGHPFLGAFPAMVREPLEASTKELNELGGVAIYNEGSVPIGIWLISDGLVKWTSTSLINNHSLHPIFSHGSSLGLYEVLAGKPYICNMITDSAAHYFFIDAGTIRSLLRSDPTVEGFLWQESIIVIARLLLPQVFDRMSIQALRALVVERSTMNMYTRGEIVDIPHYSVGFLLEGLVKPHEVQEEPIPSPAVLLPRNGDISFLSLETSGAKTATFSHQGCAYVVEARARLIIFNMEALEDDGVFQKRPSSWLSHLVDLPSGQNREHGGLVSWPEHFYMPRRRRQYSKENGKGENSLSARAMQLSIFGSLVNNTDTRTQNFPMNSHVKLPHSLSYPGISLTKTNTHALASPQSEEIPTVGEFTGPDLNGTTPHRSKKITNAENGSSEVPGNNNDFIVRIDSPSNVSSPQTP